MCANPKSLKDLCLKYLCHNIEYIYKTELTSETDSESECVFINKNVFLPKELSEEFLTKLSEQNKLNDEILSMFNYRNVFLKNIILPNAKKITSKGLKTFKKHKFKKLKVDGMDCTVNELINSFGEWTTQNLESLSVSNSSFPNDSKDLRFNVVVSLSKFKNLRLLNVSDTEFSTNNLRSVIDDLPHLDSLDISSTYVDTLLPLEKLKNQLHTLKLYNLKNAAMDVIDFSPLKSMVSLTHLDVSTEMCCFPFKSSGCETPRLERLLHPDWLPNLISLDLSGNCEVGPRIMQDFLTTHKKLRFLGLMRMENCGLDLFTDLSHPLYRSDLIVTGYMTKDQLLAGLKYYLERPKYIHETLFFLYRWIVQDNSLNDDIIELILYVMNYLSDSYIVQVEATACLYEITRNNSASRIHPSIWSRVAEVTLDAMKRYRFHYKIQNNILLVLSTDRILQDEKMDKIRCAELTMESFGYFNDINIEFLSIDICSKLARKMTTSEISQLGSNHQYIYKLLSTVVGRIFYRIVDTTMISTLSILWNFTDESPITCKIFIDNGGLMICKDLLNIFINVSTVEMKVLGLMINIAEIPYLRATLIHHDNICNLRRLLKSKQFDLSYLAARLIAHLACESGWEIYTNNNKAEVLEELRYVVKQWVPPEEEIVSYRSFQPFIGLLYSRDTPQVQFWAAWAIHHMCIINPNKYCEMIKQENGIVILQNIASDISVDPDVFSLCHRILNLIIFE